MGAGTSTCGRPVVWGGVREAEAEEESEEIGTGSVTCDPSKL